MLGFVAGGSRGLVVAMHSDIFCFSTVFCLGQISVFILFFFFFFLFLTFLFFPFLSFSFLSFCLSSSVRRLWSYHFVEAAVENGRALC